MSIDDNPPERPLSRRNAIAGIGAVAILGVGGCARYGGPNSPAENDGGTGGTGETGGEGQASSGTVLGKADDIPVGGGTVFADEKLVVTQPAAGEFKGYTAVCTHQGCILDKVDGGTINCTTDCGHGSRFDIGDGSVVDGPAAQPLPSEQISVNDEGDIVTGLSDDEETEDPQAADGTVIKTANSPYGQMLFDDSGQAIYLFDKEKSGKPECYGSCAAAWPPVLTDGKPRPKGGVRGSLLGTAKRTDGKTQVTYNNHPLYFYAHEAKNEVKCHNVEGFGGLWLVVRPNGDAAPA